MSKNGNPMKPEDLKKIRQKMKLTQGGLAKKLKRSPRYVTSREIGEAEISEEFKLAVLQLFDNFKSNPK